MKRRYALVALGLLFCAISGDMQACCTEMRYRSKNTVVEVGDTRWILYYGDVYRVAISGGRGVCSFEMSNSLDRSKVLYAPIDSTTYPTILHYTSKTTPLVPGRIVRILLDDRKRLWAINSVGDASMFDGVSWETFSHRYTTNFELSQLYLNSEVDVQVRDGVLRIASSQYIDEIDMQISQRRSLLESNGSFRNARFIGFDSVLCKTTDNIVLVDFARNTIDVSHRVDNRADERNNGRFTPRFHDLRTNSTPCDVRTSDLCLEDFGKLFRTVSKQYPPSLAPSAIVSTLRSMNLPVEDTVLSSAWTTDGPGAFLDMIADANGTIYLAGFDGITVIPMSLEERISLVSNSSISNAVVYPNPAAQHTTIELPVEHLRETTALIVDASGNTMYTTVLHNPSTLVDLTSYPNGMYTVVLTSDRARVARSLIVQR